MKRVPLFLIHTYQTMLPVRKAVSQNLIHIDRSCRFAPTCSEYSMQAIKKYGVLKGIRLGVWRFIRCNPLFKGGLDPLT